MSFLGGVLRVLVLVVRGLCSSSLIAVYMRSRGLVWNLEICWLLTSCRVVWMSIVSVFGPGCDSMSPSCVRSRFHWDGSWLGDV